VTTIDTIRSILGSIAPEADLAELDPDAELRDELDIDSMDFLNFVTALGKEFSVPIPEVDYPELATLASCARYLEDHATPS
jgi:acyl carrier protein